MDLLWCEGDQGILEGPEGLLAHTPNSTWLTHWGLYKDNRIGGWRKAHRPGQVIKLSRVLAGCLFLTSISKAIEVLKATVKVTGWYTDTDDLMWY